MQKKRQIAMVVTKRPLGSPPDDLQYWLSRPAEERLAQLEEIRREYHAWRYGGELDFQRVITIHKLK